MGRPDPTVSGPVRSVRRRGLCSVGELGNAGGDPAPGVGGVVIAIAGELVGTRRTVQALCCRSASVSRRRRARYRARVSRSENSTLVVGKRLAAIIAWLGQLCVKVAADGTDINRRGCRPAHCRRVCLCRRAWRRRHPARAGGRDRAAVWRAIPASATTAPASPGEIHPPSLNGEWRRVLFARSFWNAKVFERTGSAEPTCRSTALRGHRPTPLSLARGRG